MPSLKKKPKTTAADGLPAVVAIVGPTATGKSDLGVLLSTRLEGEVVSADSRQVYRGLNLGSGKITKREMRGIRHHLLDVADPRKQFSAGAYRTLAQAAVAEILKRGKLPIICGGTGFYIDALLGQMSLPEVEPNQKLRKKLEGKTADELFGILEKMDAGRAKTVDAKNPQRLVRAIEIAEALGKVPKPRQEIRYRVLTIGLDFPDAILKARIRKRLLARLKQGMLAEAKKLHQRGLSFRRMESLGLEYEAMALFLQKKISRNEMIEKLERDIWLFVKRQRRWFKRHKDILWYKPQEHRKIMSAVQEFLLAVSKSHGLQDAPRKLP